MAEVMHQWVLCPNCKQRIDLSALNPGAISCTMRCLNKECDCSVGVSLITGTVQIVYNPKDDRGPETAH